jgi:Fe-S-cluster-containing dehydrogenase component
MEPACVEVCPVGARVFGDLTDTASPISEFLRRRDTEVLKPELGTRPQVFYATADAAPAGPAGEI